MPHLGDLVDSEVLVDDEGSLGIGIADGVQQGLARSIVDSSMVDDRQARLHIIEDLSCLGGGEVARLHSNRSRCQHQWTTHISCAPHNRLDTESGHLVEVVVYATHHLKKPETCSWSL